MSNSPVSVLKLQAITERYIPAEVIESWIRTFTFDNKDLQREDGKVMIESVYALAHLLTVQLDKEELKNKGKQYLQHDMIFLPLRQENDWYLVVINAAKQSIQILDPSGKSKLGESKLKTLLSIMQQCVEHAAKEGHSNV